MVGKDFMALFGSVGVDEGEEEVVGRSSSRASSAGLIPSQATASRAALSVRTAPRNTPSGGSPECAAEQRTERRNSLRPLTLLAPTDKLWVRRC